jgi:glycosyltransferase involved in cell wall biosynthesis
MQAVSVVIPVKNDAQRLLRAVVTVRTAEPNAEVIIVDNASTDDTGAIAARIGDLVLHRAGPIGECRRPAVERAAGDVVFFMDADQQVLSATISAACSALTGHEAVVVPERPSVTNSLWSSILTVERTWAEVSGLGRPRVFWRDVYLTYDQPQGVSFGEDRMIAAQVKDITISSVPILHEELESFGKLLSKYYRYGQRHSGVSGTVDAPPKAAWSYLNGSRRMPVRGLPLLPAVAFLKVAKAGAFYCGAVQARVLGGIGAGIS